MASVTFHRAIFKRGKEQQVFSKLETTNFFQPPSQKREADSDAPHLAKSVLLPGRLQAPQAKGSAST